MRCIPINKIQILITHCLHLLAIQITLLEFGSGTRYYSHLYLVATYLHTKFGNVSIFYIIVVEPIISLSPFGYGC
jgi:hypothetical protein